MTKPVNQFLAVTATKFIKEICLPLQKVGLINFMHDITFGHGQISMLVSDQNVFLFYYQNKIPMLCTDDSGRTLSPGIYLNKILEEQHRECSILMPLMVRVGEHFGQNFGKNSLHIVVRENECQHLYSLFFELEENDFLHWIVNNGSFLNDFIEDYNHVANDIILEAKHPENRIILPNSPDFLTNKSKKIDRVIVFHKTTNMPVHLSRQQSKCLTLLLKGNSAKEIAKQMKLSHRTVEHYLERIRTILGCSSNKEMIISYGDRLIE